MTLLGRVLMGTTILENSLTFLEKAEQTQTLQTSTLQSTETLETLAHVQRSCLYKFYRSRC